MDTAETTESAPSSTSEQSASTSLAIGTVIVSSMDRSATVFRPRASAPNRRHSDGAAIPGHGRSLQALRRHHRLRGRGRGRGGRHKYSHPSKYQHHDIYSSESPQFHKHSKRRQRKHQNSLTVHEATDAKISGTEALELRHDDVYKCSECGASLDDDRKGHRLSKSKCLCRGNLRRLS